MANTPPPNDPQRNPDPGAKKPEDDSFDDLPPLDPGSLDLGELPADAFLEPPAGDSLGGPDSLGGAVPGSLGGGGPGSGEVAYGALPPVADPASMDGLSFGGLPDVGDLPTAGLSKIQGSGDPESGTEWHPPSHAGSGDPESFAVPTADPASVTDSAQLAVPLDLSGSDDLVVPEALPGSDLGMNPIPPEVKNYDPVVTPVAPVAPAAGWLDSDQGVPAEAPPQQPPETDDPFASPDPAVESSDIFGSGPVRQATSVEHSDVIAATAFGESTPTDREGSPDRTSDVALSFDAPLGGSTAQERGANSDLPVADEVLEAEDVTDESESLFDQPAPELPFDSAKLASAPGLPDATDPVDVPEFGQTPDGGADASSILAELMDPGERGTQDSSAVKLEAPGVERTLSSDHGESTEFDLTVDGLLPHELIADADGGAPHEWGDMPGPEMFAGDDRTTPEVDLGAQGGRVTPLDPTLPVDEPGSLSSIFSSTEADEGAGSEVPLDATPAPGESDSSVEFSPYPDAEDEAAASAILGRGATTPPPAKPRPPSKQSVSDFELPAETAADDPAAMDWSLTHETDVPPGAGDPARGAGSSSILGRGPKPAGDSFDGTLPETPAAPPPGAKDRPAPPKAGRPPSKAPTPKTPSKGDRGASDPSVEIDWLAGSASAELAPVDDPGSAETLTHGTDARDKGRGKPAPAKPAKAAPDRAATSKKGAWVGGTIIGMIIAGGGFAGAYFGGFIPNSQPTAQRPGGNTGQTGTNTGANPGTPTASDAAAAVRAGDHARARQIVADLKDATPAGKAIAGEAGLFALVQENGTAVAADNADLKAARENLQAVVDDEGAAATAEGKKAAVKAAVQLGLSHELTGDRAAAKKVYEDAKAKFPDHAATFEAALDRLAATAPATEPTSRRLTPADARQLLLAITLLQADEKAEEPEAGVYFWKAVNQAAGGKYAEAIEEIKKAKAAHVKQAKAMAGRGLNPLSDPLEQIFARSCDDLKAYWELRAAIYANKAVADLYKKDGAKAFEALAKKADEAVTLMTNLKDATDKLAKASTDLTKANADLKKAETDVKDAKAMVTTLQKDIKAAEEIKLAIEQKLDVEAKARKAAELAQAAAETARVKSEQFVASLAKELQTAKLLPEKYDAAELLAAMKRTAERATGPNLTTLVPTAMMAVGGSGLSAGQLVDIAERLTKAETAAKVANDRLAAETKRLTTDHAAALKKLTDAHAADLKKLTDTYATDVSKLKDDQKAELKKAADQLAADSKTLKESFDGKVKDLEAAVESEKQRVKAVTAQFKIDLGNAISPSQALDLWLPLLTELRRPSDSEPALAGATKVIASAAPDSEDSGKARTVAGMALLNKGDLTLAKAQFEAAKANPAHKPALAARKPWAVAADVGLASVTDPLAPYRRPVELPARDPAAAARLLDAGVKAYRAEYYREALAALTDSTKADPTNPVAWYYLGAARWAAGQSDGAKDAFRQGGIREAASSVPARTIGAAIAPIQGPARDALTAARP